MRIIFYLFTFNFSSGINKSSIFTTFPSSGNVTTPFPAPFFRIVNSKQNASVSIGKPQKSNSNFPLFVAISSSHVFFLNEHFFTNSICAFYYWDGINGEPQLERKHQVTFDSVGQRS
jgi:hypothetical protein